MGNWPIPSRIVQIDLALRDLPAARAVLRSASAVVDSTPVIHFSATTGDHFWLLTDAQQRELDRADTVLPTRGCRTAAAGTSSDRPLPVRSATAVRFRTPSCRRPR